MKKIIQRVAIVLLCGVLATATCDAKGRNDHGNSGTSHSQKQNRPGNMGRPAGNNGNHNGNVKPGNNGNHNGNVKPGNNGNHNGNMRPGNNGNHNGNVKPGNNGNHNGNMRPGNNGNHIGNVKPGNNGNHNGNMRPGNNGNHNGNGFWGNNGNVKPPHNNNFNGHGPSHPNRPPQYAWHRPQPPHNWRPSSSWRPFHSILGIAFGSAVNFTVNALIGNGYNVVSYGPSGVWVENVPMLNMMWPDAQLFYNNAGGLCGSRFIYSTAYDNWNRYNMTYTSLVNAYGMPISTQNTASGVEVTWWGTGNQFIRLAYNADYSPAGALRYYTTLSFGN